MLRIVERQVDVLGRARRVYVELDMGAMSPAVPIGRTVAGDLLIDAEEVVLVPALIVDVDVDITERLLEQVEVHEEYAIILSAVEADLSAELISPVSIVEVGPGAHVDFTAPRVPQFDESLTGG